MMSNIFFVILAIITICDVVSLKFLSKYKYNHPSIIISDNRKYSTILFLAKFQIPSPPDTPKSRLILQIEGTTVNNALFRAELKKELTFFRGCSAVYIQNGDDSAELVTEGKTNQLVRFIQWIELLSLSVSERKPNFQGPNLVAHITSLEWLDYQGDLKGFNAAADVPTLLPDNTSNINASGTYSDGNMMEAKSMTGTDESV